MIEAYLSTSLVGWRVGSAVARWVTVPDLTTALRVLEEGSAAEGAHRLRVWLSARLAPPLILPSECGAQSRAEAETLVGHALKETFPQAPSVTTWMGPWKQGAAVIAAGVDTALLEVLKRASLDGRRHWWSLRARGILSVSPWWSLPMALAAASQAGECFTLEEPDGLLLWRNLHGAIAGNGAWVSVPPESQKIAQRRRFDATSPTGSPPATHWRMTCDGNAFPIGTLTLISDSAAAPNQTVEGRS